MEIEEGEERLMNKVREKCYIYIHTYMYKRSWSDERVGPTEALAGLRRH